MVDWLYAAAVPQQKTNLRRQFQQTRSVLRESNA